MWIVKLPMDHRILNWYISQLSFFMLFWSFCLLNKLWLFNFCYFARALAAQFLLLIVWVAAKLLQDLFVMVLESWKKTNEVKFLLDSLDDELNWFAS